VPVILNRCHEGRERNLGRAGEIGRVGVVDDGERDARALDQVERPARADIGAVLLDLVREFSAYDVGGRVRVAWQIARNEIRA